MARYALAGGLAGCDCHACCGGCPEDTEFWCGGGGWGDCPEHGVHPHPNPPSKGEGIIGGGLRGWFRLGGGAEVLGVGVAGAWARGRGGEGGFGRVDIKLGIDYRVGGIYN